VIGLVLIAALALVFVAAFWWALPHDMNPWPFTRWGGAPYRSGFGEIEVHRALEEAGDAAGETEREERKAHGEEESGASWMELPGAYGDDQADAAPPPLPRSAHHRHTDADDLPLPEDIARYGGEPDFGGPTAAVDENAEPPAHVSASDDENADLPDEDDRRP
jgi:hypothetical protein